MLRARRRGREERKTKRVRTVAPFQNPRDSKRAKQRTGTSQKQQASRTKQITGTTLNIPKRGKNGAGITLINHLVGKPTKPNGRHKQSTTIFPIGTIQRSRTRGSRRTITSGARRAGTGRGTRRSEVITLNGMIRDGGAIATTALSLTLAAGITGMQAGGIQRGATLRIRITPTTARSMDIMVYHLIR
jgi:hypothetical protein